MEEKTRASELAAETLTSYIADEVMRAFATHDRAGRGTVQRHLPLGEMLALFNLADQFGLIDRVRADLDRRRGNNAYLAFSEAMKASLLDRGFGDDPPPPRPAPDRPRDQRGGPPQQPRRNRGYPPPRRERE